MISIRTNAAEVARAIAGVIRDMEDTLPARHSRIERIIRRGIDRNFHVLGWGGSQSQWGGPSITWDKIRHPITEAVRERQGLGKVTPMLQLRGQRLRRGYVRGGALSGSRRLKIGGYKASYRGAADVRELGEAHQLTGIPLPPKEPSAQGDYSNIIKSMPKRPFLFWSRDMAMDVKKEVIQHFRRSMAYWSQQT